MAKKIAEIGNAKLSQTPKFINKIQVNLIHDSEVYAIMARVNKVIVGANLVTADGGFFGTCGINMVTSAAKVMAVPVICIVPIYKVFIFKLDVTIILS